MEDYNKLESIKFDGLINIAYLDTIAKFFLNSKVFQLLDPDPNSDKINKISPSSGLACFIYGFAFEHGDGNQFKSNLEQAIIHYQLGVNHFFDPLCAYRLAEIYSQPQSAKQFSKEVNKTLAYGYLLISMLFRFQFHHVVIKEDQCELPSLSIVFSILLRISDSELKYTRRLFDEFINYQLEKTSPLVIMKQIVFDFFELAFRSKNGQVDVQNYYQLLINNLEKNRLLKIPQYVWLCIQLITLDINVSDKKMMEISQILSNDCIECIQNKNKQLHKNKQHQKLIEPLSKILIFLSNTFGLLQFQTQDSVYFEKQREQLFEVVYFYKYIIELNQMEKDADFKEFKINLSLNFGILYNCMSNIQKNTHRAHIIRSFVSLEKNSTKAKIILTEDPKNKPKELDFYKLAKICQKENDNINQKKYYLELAKKLYSDRLIQQKSAFDSQICHYYLGRIAIEENDLTGASNQLQASINSYEKNPQKRMVKTFQFFALHKRAYQQLVQILQKQAYQNEFVFKIIENQNKDIQQHQPIELRQVVFLPEQINYTMINFENEDFINPKVLNMSSTSNNNDIINNNSELDLSEKVFIARGNFETSYFIVYIKNKRHSLKEMYNPADFNNILENIQFNQHPNLRQILGYKKVHYFDQNEKLQIFYEFAEYNLYSFAKRDNITFSDRIKVASDILEGISYMKTNRLNLDNIKPSNILIKKSSKGKKKYTAIISDWELRRNKLNHEYFLKINSNFEKDSELFSLGWLLGILFLKLDIGIEKDFQNLYNYERLFKENYEEIKDCLKYEGSNNSLQLVKYILCLILNSQPKPTFENTQNFIKNLIIEQSNNSNQN